MKQLVFKASVHRDEAGRFAEVPAAQPIHGSGFAADMGMIQKAQAPTVPNKVKAKPAPLKAGCKKWDSFGCGSVLGAK